MGSVRLLLVIVGLLLLAAALPAAGEGSTERSQVWQETEAGVKVFYTAPDSVIAARIGHFADAGMAEIESFFGGPYLSQFGVHISPSRAALDKQWQADWNAPEFESSCWMVASGVASRLDILSPRVWSDEACEHKASDTIELRKLITHELLHVYHGQRNPHPDFEGLDEIGWFVEGLATLVSGQLDSARIERARVAIDSGDAPVELEAAWSGANRYGFSGLLVKFALRERSRSDLMALLACSTEAEVLRILGVSEERLLADWKNWVLAL